MYGRSGETDMLCRSVVWFVMGFLLWGIPLQQGMAQSSRAQSPSPQLMQVFGKYQRANKARDYKKALAFGEKALELGLQEFGFRHKYITAFLTNLSLLHKKTGRLKKALYYAQRATEVDRSLYGAGSARLKVSLIRQAGVYFSMGAYQKSLDFYRLALKNNRAAFGTGHANNATLLNNIGHVYRTVGKYKKAETFLKQALVIDLKAHGERHRKTAIDRSNLAGLYKVLGRLKEAEQQYGKALTTFEIVKGLEDIETGIMADNLGTLYLNMQQYAKARQLFMRARKIFEKADGKGSRHVGIALNNLGAASSALKDYKVAVKYYERSLLITKKYYGLNHLSTATGMDNLAGAYQQLKRYDEALELRLAALKILQDKMGSSHSHTATTLNNLADLYSDMKRYDEAELHYIAAINIWKTLYGNGHPTTITGIAGLANLYWGQKRLENGLRFIRKASGGLSQYASTNMGKVGASYSGNAVSLVRKRDYVFKDHVAIAYQRAQENGKLAGSLMDEGYQVAQWALRTSASDALGKMAARFSTNDKGLGQLIKRRQDIVALLERLQKKVSAGILKFGTRRNLKQEELLRGKISKLQSSVQQLDGELAQKFPKYATLANPRPLTIALTQKLLKPSEGLVQFLFTRTEGYAWLVTKADSKWVKIPHGSAYIFLKVLTLRCGLDAELWSRNKAREACLELLGKVMPKDKVAEAVQVFEQDGRLPFDLTTAHKLYNDLFSGFREELKSVKHLMVLPTGALSSLPFQVLVRYPVATYLASEENYNKIDWMVRGHALSVLPSVSSLTALRSLQKRKSAPRPYLGFGDPILYGKPPACPKIDVPEKCAVTSFQDSELAQRNSPKKNEDQKTSKKFLLATLEKTSGLQNLFRGSRTDTRALRQLCPLPDTAYELKCVAKTMGADQDKIFLQGRATESQVKQANKAGQLSQYRILHFATHGLLGWQAQTMLKGVAEPSLLMTPPDKATKLDDGLLSASEISKLNLNADWVILSACNTAMGNGKRFSGLSGLAKAFLYAGSRALLVSHWSVYSDAAVELTTHALSLQKRRPETGRAEAMRQSMLALMGNKGHYMAGHPAVWAPFIVVGEGG